MALSPQEIEDSLNNINAMLDSITTTLDAAVAQGEANRGNLHSLESQVPSIDAFDTLAERVATVETLVDGFING